MINNIIKLHTVKAKILAVRSWLLNNATYQSQKLTVSEAYDTAKAFVEKLDVHSVSHHTYFDEEDECSRSYYTFRITVGQPKFRGTVNYTLHEHSLVFRTDQTTFVRLAENYEHPEWIKNVAHSYFGRENASVDRWLNDNVYSAHPHINDYNEPCLGGWANAWSQTIATGNLVSLVPVAQSFLNTWTSNDAYYDINYIYRYYRTLPLYMRKMLPLPVLMSNLHLWYKFTRDGRRRTRISDFTNWVSRNLEQVEAMVYNPAYEEGVSLLRIFHAFYGAISNKVNKDDTEDKLGYQVRKGINWIETIHNSISERVNKALSYPPQGLTEAIISETIIDKANLYAPKPWSSNPSSTWHWEMSRLKDNIRSHLTNQVRNRDSISIAGVEMEELLDFMRHANRKKGYRNFSFMADEDIYKAMADTIARSNSERIDYLRDMTEALNKVYEFFGIETRVEYGDDYLYWGESIVSGFAVLESFRESLSRTERLKVEEKFADVMAYKTLCNYESKLTKMQIKGIKDGKEKYKPVQDSGFGTNAQQSQLSLESF